MASALSYVSKFKSFVILFVTPLLLLPLIILMPAKVSCVSGQPPKNWGALCPGALSWSARIPWAGRASLPQGPARALWCQMWGSQIRGAGTAPASTET